MSMIPSLQSFPGWGNRGLFFLLLALGCAGVIAFATGLFEAQRDPAVRLVAQAAPVPVPAASSSAAPDQAAWMNLNEWQRTTLLPLAAAWPGLDTFNRQRWLAVAAQMRRLSPEARARVQTRMVAWAKLSPKKRAQARLQYVYAKRVPAAKRNDLWKKYQLSPAAPVARAKPRTGVSMVAPALAQVQPGATTVPITQLLRPTTVEVEGDPAAPG